LIEEKKTEDRSKKIEVKSQQLPIVNQQPQIITTEIRNPKSEISNSGGKKSLLDILREKAGSNYSVLEVKDAEVLTEEKLMQCWSEYITKLEKQAVNRVR